MKICVSVCLCASMYVHVCVYMCVCERAVQVGCIMCFLCSCSQGWRQWLWTARPGVGDDILPACSSLEILVTEGHELRGKQVVCLWANILIRNLSTTACNHSWYSLVGWAVRVHFPGPSINIPRLEIVCFEYLKITTKFVPDRHCCGPPYSLLRGPKWCCQRETSLTN